MRHFNLLFVLLCMGTRLSAQTLKASYTVDKVAVCSSQSAVQFTDQSTGSVTSWKWNFGDGTTSTLQHPSHTFATGGRYVVYLVVADAAGKTDTAWASSQKDAVYVLPVVAAPSWYLMCPDQSVATLRDTGYAAQFPEYPATYRWSTGATTAAINVSTNGKYTVSLTQCGQTVSKEVQVQRLTSGLAVTTKDSGFHILTHNVDSVYVPWDVINPFPEGTVQSQNYDYGPVQGWTGPYYYRYFYPGYPATLTAKASVVLKPGVEYHCATTAEYTATPRRIRVVQNPWDDKDTILTAGDTIYLTDINQNVNSRLWYGPGTRINSSTFAVTGAGTVDLTGWTPATVGNPDQVRSILKVTVVPKVDFDTIHQCDPRYIDLVFTGKSVVSDSIVSYEYRNSNGEVIGSGKTVTLYNLPEGANTVTLTVKTVSGKTISTTKTITGPKDWKIDVALTQMYGCGDSALLSTTHNATDAYTVRWRTGETGNRMVVNKTDWYYVSLVNDCGSIVAADSIYINLDIPKMPPLINRVNNMLVTIPYDGYTNNWYRNDTLVTTGMEVELTQPGIYTVDQIIGNCRQLSAPYNYLAGLTVKLEVTIDPCDPQTVTMQGRILYVNEGEHVTAEVYDFGDGTWQNDEVKPHYYAQPGEYTLTYMVTTSANKMTVVERKITIKQAPAIRMEIHRGANDTIIAYPVNYDKAHYQQVQWLKDEVAIPGADAWYIIPSSDGYYRLKTSAYDCYYASPIYYTAVTAKTIVVVPAANADSLRMEANFRGTTFNSDNEFTIQLSTDNGNARTLDAGEVINLGIIKGTDPTRLTVAIPDSLACASNYVIRVIASSPADITTWSGSFAITNTPAQPVLTQAGDSLFTDSNYALQWYKDDVAIPGTTAAAIRAKANGVYKVAALNGACSTLSEARTVVVTAVTDVTLGGNKVTAFPNPSEGKVYLKFAAPLTGKVLVNVINVNGVTAYSTTTIQQQTLLDLSSLPKGFYLVEVTGNGARKVLTIILQ